VLTTSLLPLNYLINSQENQNIIFENNNRTDFEEDTPSEVMTNQCQVEMMEK
jgi:hypothetical protein